MRGYIAMSFIALDIDTWVRMTKYILGGTGVTLKLYIVTAMFSLPLGLGIALGKISKNRLLCALLQFYTWLFRGTPLLLQLFFMYFGLGTVAASLGIEFLKFSPFQAAATAFILNYGAYLAEIFRAGIQSVSKGQYEAAYALGLNYSQAMRYVILPQMVRRVLPPTCNEAITLVKDTALVVAIGMGDLLRASKEIVTREMVISPFIIAAVIYLIFTSVIVVIFRKIEAKYAVYDA